MFAGSLLVECAVLLLLVVILCRGRVVKPEGRLARRLRGLRRGYVLWRFLWRDHGWSHWCRRQLFRCAQVLTNLEVIVS